jgi:hypothetical protein
MDSIDMDMDMATIQGIFGCNPLNQPNDQGIEHTVAQWKREDLEHPYDDAAGENLVDVIAFASDPRPSGMKYGGSWPAVYDFCRRFPVFLQYHDGKERPHCLRPATLNNKPYPCKGYADDDELRTKRILTQNELSTIANRLSTALRRREERATRYERRHQIDETDKA